MKKQTAKRSSPAVTTSQLRSITGGRRAADFTGNQVVDVKLDDLDAGSK